MRRIAGIIIVVLLLIVALVPRAEAGIIVDHPPLNSGGPSADTDFRTTFGDPYWQLLADDFTLAASASVVHVKWWGFYGNNFANDSVQPPVGDESMRIRFHDDQGENGVPGNMLYEQTVLNPSRNTTGRSVITTRIHPEFVFETLLPVPFSASASTRYWMEIVQVGIPQSVFRWEVSNAPADVYAFINPDFSQWNFDLPTHANLAFQLSDVPEPSAISIAMMGFMLFPRSRHRRLSVSRNRNGLDSP